MVDPVKKSPYNECDRGWRPPLFAKLALLPRRSIHPEKCMVGKHLCSILPAVLYSMIKRPENIEQVPLLGIFQPLELVAF